MLGLIARWLLTALALILTTKIVPGIQIASFTTLLVAALVLGLLNAIVRPILIFFTLPLTIVTLGLFILIINGFTFWLAAHFVPGFHVNSFFASLLGAVVLSLLSWFFSIFIKVGEKHAH